MSFEPQKFFVGLVDFFSILMPGGLLAYLGKDWAACVLLDQSGYRLEGAEAWMVFLFASYLLGHFLFLIGSLLDDLVYDPLRKMTDKKQITHLLSGRALSPRVLRWLAGLCFKTHSDAAVDLIVSLKEQHLRMIGDPDSVNAFQWCKARLAIEHPEALTVVSRFEADSKFFRSFLPVLVGMWGIALYLRDWALALGLAFLLILAFWRYIEQRFKATQQAYWFLLTLEAGPPPRTPHSHPSSPTCVAEDKHQMPTHAGGVVFREKWGKTNYLLVQAKTDANQWVLPKGHIEMGEDSRRCAIREVREETGVWARIKSELKVIDYTLKDLPVKAQFYLMEAVRGREA